VSLNGATTTSSTLVVGTTLTTGGSASVSGNLTLEGAGRSIQATENNTLTLGGATTGDINLNENTYILGSNTFSVGTGLTSLGGAINVTGVATFDNNITQTGSSTFSTGTGNVTLNGNTTVSTGVSFTANGPVALDPDSGNDIVITTAFGSGSYLQILGLDTQTGTQLCVDGSNQVVKCSAGSTTLQGAYDGGNTITTANSRDITINLAGNENLTATTSAGSNGYTSFALANGANSNPPSQLVLIDNQDTNEALPVGLRIK
jgi:hypothetical protein